MRRSVRAFLPELILDDILDASFNLATVAPISRNLKIWRFFDVRDPEKIAKLRLQLASGRADANAHCGCRTVRSLACEAHSFDAMKMMRCQMMFGPNEKVFGESEPSVYVYKGDLPDFAVIALRVPIVSKNFQAFDFRKSVAHDGAAKRAFHTQAHLKEGWPRGSKSGS